MKKTLLDWMPEFCLVKDNSGKFTISEEIKKRFLEKHGEWDKLIIEDRPETIMVELRDREDDIIVGYLYSSKDGWLENYIEDFVIRRYIYDKPRKHLLLSFILTSHSGGGIDKVIEYSYYFDEFIREKKWIRMEDIIED